MAYPRVDKVKLLEEFRSRFENNKHSRLRVTTKNWCFWVNPWSRPYSVQYVEKYGIGDPQTYFRFVIKDGKWIIVEN